MNWNNLTSMHHRWMMRYLRKRGWVVFYLEGPCRQCVTHEGCWLALYQAEEARENTEKSDRVAAAFLREVK